MSEVSNPSAFLSESKDQYNVPNTSSQNNSTDDNLDFLPNATDMPHHQVPNFAAILPDYTNMEQDYIRQAFSRTSFVSVRDLPSTFKPSATARAMANKMNTNRRSVANVDANAVNGRHSTAAREGVFSTFDYIPSRYSLADELRTKDRLEAEAKMLDIGGRDFVPSGLPKRQKYEDIFENPEYRFPYMGDAFEAASDQQLRSKWIENAKVLHGPFVPTSSKARLEKPTRIMLPDLVRELHVAVAKDWNDVAFEVMTTEDDHVAVRFLIEDVRSPRGLAAYMNVLAGTSHIVAKYQLSKVVEDWNSRPGDNYLYYLFR
jgi:hypothetical protein|tara:strand:- start:137 stop:1087 length:951 start_codon:yes stop_codon:yes gene_type:complete